jgi:hypothetical protein
MTMYHSNRSQEGYLLVDHRNSPGITQADLLMLPDYARDRFMPMTGLYESPTIRCSHCGTMVVINPQRTRARGYCAKCDHYICDSPLCHANCTPFMQQIEALHEQAVRQLNIKEM